MLNTPQIIRSSIEGKVIIKRKTAWVQRYAQVRDAIFQYKQDRYSINARYITDLRNCIVRKGTLEKGQGYFEIKDKGDKNAEVIRITFDDDATYKKWGIVFMESIKSDQQLRDQRQ